MPPSIPRKRKYLKKRAGPRRPRKSAPRSGPALRKVIRKVISSQAEHKQMVYANTAYPSVMQATTTSIAGNTFTMTPSLTSLYGPTTSRGTGDAQFVGNSFRITKFIHTLVMAPTPYNATTNTQVRPLLVRLYYFKSKLYPTGDFTNASLVNQYGQFFANGANDCGFAGSLMDMTRKIQSENFTYLTSRTYKIGNAVPGIGSGSTTAHNLTNNDFKMSVIANVNLTRFFKAPIRISDAGTTTNSWIYLLIQVVAADGTLMSTSQIPLMVQNEMKIDYIDE